MSARTPRWAALAVLALAGLSIGLWAYFFPVGWYERFPGFGRSWLPPLGPYNQHLVKDTGALYLGLAVLALLALWHHRNNALAQAAGAAWLVFDVLHLVYHAQHLHVYDTTDKVLNVVLFGVLILASLLAMIPVTARTHTESGTGVGAGGGGPVRGA